MKFDIKKILKKIGDYLIEFLKLIWEIILFILNLPTSIRHILRGLRTIGESYDVILKMEENIVGELTENNLKSLKDNPEDIKELQIISDKLEEILKLSKERGRKFNQLFSNFLAIFALIISICVLIFSLKIMIL